MRSGVGYGVLALLVLAFMEGASWIAGGLVTSRGLFYAPHPLEGFADYAARRDPELGWPSPSEFGGDEFDTSGSRIVPAHPEPGGACASLYGDSFTWGHGVDHAEAWGNQVSSALGCRVANYAVAGYGSDQALMRFERNRDEAPVVVLVHLSENVLRNVNQLRSTLYGSNSWGLKPRFVLAGDGLDVVPMPLPDEQAYRDIVLHPERHLEHEFFAPGGPSGKNRLSFPALLGMLRLPLHFQIQAIVSGRPWYEAFYEPDHPARGLDLTTRILQRFHRIAGERGKRSLAVLMPTALDVKEALASGRWTYAKLVDHLKAEGVPFFDVGPALVAAIGERDPCDFYRRCRGHPNAAGSALIAELVVAQLRERGLAPTVPAAR